MLKIKMPTFEEVNEELVQSGQSKITRETYKQWRPVFQKKIEIEQQLFDDNVRLLNYIMDEAKGRSWTEIVMGINNE